MPDAHITVTEIRDDFDAQRSDMRDSPTILINGNNPFDGLDSVTSLRMSHRTPRHPPRTPTSRQRPPRAMQAGARPA
ncbi:MAG: hypothetical protein H0X35_15990 [Pseudonocardiales bacterium]|nr:hypothetical protein [Pseudonocardiales bacterium]